MKLLSIKEFSERSGLIESRVRTLVKAEGFPVIRIGATYNIHAEEAEKWITKHYGKKIEDPARKQRYLEDRKRRKI